MGPGRMITQRSVRPECSSRNLTRLSPLRHRMRYENTFPFPGTTGSCHGWLSTPLKGHGAVIFMPSIPIIIIRLFFACRSPGCFLVRRFQVKVSGLDGQRNFPPMIRPPLASLADQSLSLGHPPRVVFRCTIVNPSLRQGCPLGLERVGPASYRVQRVCV